jgi:predicted AAA+ superfamily ATPase
VTSARAYRPRVIDLEVEALLASSPVLVIEGPKACGKTSSARQVSASEVLLDTDAAARAAIAVDPTLVLDGPTPRLIDEWQIEPGLWNHVRRVADERGLPGQFILSGSAVPSDDTTRHTGAGRITRIRMRPMSLFESGHSNGSIPLSALLAGERVRVADPGLTLPAIAERISVGGWPALQELPVASALRAVASYLDEISRTDINRVGRGGADADRQGRDRDPVRVKRLLRSLARNVATPVTITRLGADAGMAEPDGDANEEDGGRALARDTVYDYLQALERLMVIEDQPPWAPHLRSRRQVRSAPHRHFVDPSLAVAALGASPERLMRDLNYLGLLFESLVVRDLRIYAQASDARVFYYGDTKSGLEVDSIVETRDGRWAAFEVKLGGERPIEEGAASLLKFARQVDTDTSGEPACLGLIVASGYGYVRDDGIQVIPIGALTS